jgi:hypothetical protein
MPPRGRLSHTCDVAHFRLCATRTRDSQCKYHDQAYLLHFDLERTFSSGPIKLFGVDNVPIGILEIFMKRTAKTNKNKQKKNSNKNTNHHQFITQARSRTNLPFGPFNLLLGVIL